MGKKARREELAVFLWLKYKITWTNHILCNIDAVAKHWIKQWLWLGQYSPRYTEKGPVLQLCNCVEQRHQSTAFILRSWLVWLFSTLSIHGWKPFNNKFLEMFTRITSHTRSESLFCRWLRQWISSGWQKLSFCVFWFVLNRFETIWRALDQSGDRKTEKKLSFCFQILKKLRFCFQKLSFFSVFSPYVEVKKPSVRKTSFFTRKKYPWRSLLSHSR